MSINLNQPRTIVFHPGIGKTATSAIQNVGFKLPANLSDQACFSPYGVHGGANNDLASNHPNFSMDKYQEQWALLLEFALNRNSSTIVSSEFLIRDNPKHIATMLKEAKEKGLNVKVIVAVRNYTDYLVSAFLQAVKVNWGIKTNENIFEFCERELASIKMPLLVDQWARHIGDENVFLLDYDTKKNGFVNLFFNTIGINLPVENKQEAKVNTSIKLATAPMLRHFDRVANDKNDRQEFINFLNKLDYKNEYEVSIKKKIESQIVKNAFSNDKERLTTRYTWI
ncbi:hypothetical protein [Psychromonas sp. SP041]|uniref:hypothetical protein n=1 Tax=Psychromonas sp. SP041 TaxID=1365007 RepID=UPI0003FDA079|nr:hypothetical protein [Psychromonas sp. SP041]